jgi:hypothetical protein
MRAATCKEIFQCTLGRSALKKLAKVCAENVIILEVEALVFSYALRTISGGRAHFGLKDLVGGVMEELP